MFQEKWREVGDLPTSIASYAICVSSRPFTPERINEDPATFHARSFDSNEQALWVPELSARRTLVLGSSQSADTIDLPHLDTQRIGIATRRSGGGAVLVSSVDLVWFDLVISRSHPQWVDDVGHSFTWLGEACAAGLKTLGVDATVHRGRMATSKWAPLICFAGLGPGELTIDGRKVVGMSQRRTRNHARFQVAILRHWSGAEHAAMLNLDPAEKAQAAIDLEYVGVGLPHSPSEILSAIFAQL